MSADQLELFGTTSEQPPPAPRPAARGTAPRRPSAPLPAERPYRHIDVSDAELAAAYVTPQRAKLFRVTYERDYRVTL